MNYEEALEYIHGISWTFCKPGLERIRALCERLGDPQKELKFVHVAGTNGKGSFCSMLDSVLRKSGYKVGLFTSPYIKVFNERMRVDGKDISNEELAELTEYIKPIAESMADKPTEFELITAVAFEYFKRNKCDIVVLEAGMGGRLDSTNIIEDPILSVITGIALDHTAFLGDSISKIAAEKAGIIKTGTPVLFGGADTEARTVIKSKAEEQKSEFFEVDHSKLSLVSASLDGTVLDYKNFKNIKLSLLGAYQPRNAAVVLTAVEILRERGIDISDEALRHGLENAIWQGRFEKVSTDPIIIFDGAHNPEGIASAVKSIKLYFGAKKVCLVTGVLRDKDYTEIAKSLSEVAEVAFTLTPDSPRALTASEYASILSEKRIAANACENISEALEKAKEYARKNCCPVICLGSLYMYCEFSRLV